MPEFWRASGFHLLARNAAGHLAVSDDFLRAYLLRPEIHPIDDSCAAERSLHAALMDAPRRAVAAAALDAIADEDARDNYRLMLRFRDRLIAAGTVEACYAGLFRGDAIDVPPLFIDQLAHVILRNVLDARGQPTKVKLELYVDMTDGRNGGTWTKVTEYTDAGEWGKENTPCSVGTDPATLALRSRLLLKSETGRPELTVYFRHEYAVMLYRRLSVREIEPLRKK